MEKRSFILGLGIGIIFSVIISWAVYGISGKGDLTKEELEQKARELGMEYSSETAVYESESETSTRVISYPPATYEAETNEQEFYKNEESSAVEKSTNINLQKTDNSNNKDESRRSDNNAIKNKRADNDAVKKENDNNTENIFNENPDENQSQAIENSANTAENSQNEQADDGQYIDVTISSGSNAKGVSNMLAEKGIVENASDYEKYLIDNKKTKRIRSGTYKIPKNVDYDNLTDIISKNNH